MPDVDVDAFLAGIECNTDNASLDTATNTSPAAVTMVDVDKLGIDLRDTTMEGGGFHPVEITETSSHQGGIASGWEVVGGGQNTTIGITEMMNMNEPSYSSAFPGTGGEESQIVTTPIDEQLVAYEDGMLLQAILQEGVIVKEAESEMEGQLDDNDDSRMLMGYVDDRSKDHSIDRRLQDSQGMNTATIGLFQPLACNANIDIAVCSRNKLSTLLSGNNAMVTVPCGMCVTYDLPATPTTIGGLNIIGKLYVPPNHKSTLLTKFVFVQGVLEMSDTSPISKNNTSMKIVLTGDTDVTFVPAVGNANVVGGTFNAGVKPFLVVGGRLDIRGWAGSLVEGGAVETWTTLLDMAVGPMPNLTLSAVPGKEQTTVEPPMMIGGEPGQQCPRKVVDHNFDDVVDYSVWSGGEGMILHHTHDLGKAIVLDGLGRGEQGFRLDMSDIVKECPIIANATYLVTMRLKIEPNGTAPGTKSSCEITGNNCPRIYRKILRSAGGDRYYEQVRIKMV